MDVLYYFFRFYSVGKLDEGDMVHYVRTHALMYEYYRQAQEVVPPHIGRVLHQLFTSEAYQIVNSRYNTPTSLSVFIEKIIQNRQLEVIYCEA